MLLHREKASLMKIFISSEESASLLILEAMIAAADLLIEDCLNTKLVKNFSRLGSASIRKATSSLIVDQTF